MLPLANIASASERLIHRYVVYHFLIVPFVTRANTIWGHIDILKQCYDKASLEEKIHLQIILMYYIKVIAFCMRYTFGVWVEKKGSY